MSGNLSNAYSYPASYDEAISVTSVGSKIAPTYYSGIAYCDTCIPNYFPSWKDVHLLRPGTDNTSHTHNTKVNVAAPGHFVTTIASDFTEHPSGYQLSTGTSNATPFVTALAGLIFSVNPNFTPSEVKSIIESTTDDIYYIPYNQPYVGLLGTGRINAYRAVLTAKCMTDSNFEPSLDLMIRNSINDYGVEPYVEESEYPIYNSSDIWMRNNSGEKYIDIHQNPEYDTETTNYVYVRVTNRSCVTSTGNEELQLYWSKSNAGPSDWPELWNGSINIDGIPLGGLIDTVLIPSLEPGESTVVEIPWLIPNPTDYNNITADPWHFCLIARINSTEDPMTYPEVTSNYLNVKNNNNIAWKNLNIIDINPNTLSVGSNVAIQNTFDETKAYALEVNASLNAISLHQEAEISIKMDEILFNAWVEGGKKGSNFKETRVENVIIATHEKLTLDNLIFEPNEVGLAFLSFNFLTQQITNQKTYEYHVIQRDKINNNIIGGVVFEIRKSPREGFTANAGGNKQIDIEESVTLEAEDINEEAKYNWYDAEGNLIYTGSNFVVSPEITQKYKLEIISDLDGLKDYDEIEVKVNPYKLGIIEPNPASSFVNINYNVEKANSAYLMLVLQSNGSTNNYILDKDQKIINIDVSNLQTGIYSVILVCNGVIQNSTNIIIN